MMSSMELSRAVPILTVDDLDAAVRTYRTVLGLDVLMNLGWIATLGCRDRRWRHRPVQRDDP